MRRLRGSETPGMVTGEAVLLDVPAASLPARAVAALIDWLLYLAGFVAVALALIFSTLGSSDATMQTVLLLAMVGCLLIVPVTVETLSRGRSLGKLIMRLRVVRDDGGPIAFRQALVRGLIAIVEIWMLQGIVAIVAAASNSKGKRLGDLAAGTYVVREQTGLKLEPPPYPNPALRAWANTADITALPDGLALAVRQFLLRRSGLSSAARARLGAELTGQVARHVSPPPPPGFSDEDFLGAVLAYRRDREAQRLQAQDRLRASVLPPDPVGRTP